MAGFDYKSNAAGMQIQGPGILPGRNRIMLRDTDTSAQERAASGDYRDAYRGNMFDAGDARNQQMGALGLQREAAFGSAPSRAEILGHQMIGDSLNAQLAGAASGRGGPMGQAAAIRSAQLGAAGFQQHGVNDIAAMRAQEMADARNAYMTGASGIRGQDYGAAGMNQQGALANQSMANDLMKSQAGLDAQNQLDQSANWRAERGLNEQHWANQAGLNQHRTDKNTDLIKDVAGGVMKGISAISDPSAKSDIHDLNQPMGKHAPWMPAQEDVNYIHSGYDASARPSEAMLADRAAQPGTSPTAFDALNPSQRWFQTGMSGQANPAAPFLQNYMAGQDQAPATVGATAPPDSPTAQWERDARDQVMASDNRAEAAKIRSGFEPSPSSDSPGGFSKFMGGFSNGFAVSDPSAKSFLAPLNQPDSEGAQAHDMSGALGGMQGGMGGADSLQISDPRAKREAFQSGVLYADGDPAAQKLPDYMASDRELKTFQRQDAGKAGAAIRRMDAAVGDDREAERLGTPTGPNRFDTPIASGPVVYPLPLVAALRGRSAVDRALANRQWQASLGPVQSADGMAPPQAPPPTGANLGAAFGPGPAPAPMPPQPSPKTYREMPEEDRVVSDPRAKTMEGAGDMPSVYYGPDGRPYVGNVALTEKPREMKSFARDTPAQQRVVKDKYYADVARKADEAIAALQAATGGPSSVDKTAKRDTSKDAFSPQAGDPRIAAPAQMMDAIGGGKSFRYRPEVPGEDPNEVHFGTTTADLRQTPMGASMVVPGGPDTGGYEAIDTREAVGPTLAALGNLNQRLRRMERGRGR